MTFPTPTRRHFLLAATGALLLPRAAFAQSPEKPLDYEPGVLQHHLDKGETVLLDFWASWCSTCAAQDAVLKKLAAANSDYVDKITYIRVDWDTFGEAMFTRRMHIPRRSTLVLLKGSDELGRLVADTREENIRALLDKGVAAQGY